MAVYEVTKRNRTSYLSSHSKRLGTKHKGVARTFIKVFVLFLLWFNVPVNNFSVMLRRSHLFLGITSTFGE